jgi:hypothetical protein
MTCCIVVALIISQILAYRDRIKRLLGFQVDDDAGHEPLVPLALRRRMRLAIFPVVVLCATVVLGYQHRHHLAELAMPAAHAIGPAICVSPTVDGRQESNRKPKETQ